MISSCRPWLSGLAAAVALLPASAETQTTARSFEELQRILRAEEGAVVIERAGQQTGSEVADISSGVTPPFLRERNLGVSSLLPIESAGNPPHQRYAQGGNSTSSPGLSPRFEVLGGYSYLPELDRYALGNEPGHGWAIALNVNLGRFWGLVFDMDGQTWTVWGQLSSVYLGGLQCPGDYGCTVKGDEGISLNYFSVGPRIHIRTGRLTVFALADAEVQHSRYSEQDLAHVGRADDAEFVNRLATRPQSYSSNRPFVLNTWDRPLERYGDNVVGRARMAASSSGAWGFGFGGGVDVSLGRRIGVRLVQVNYSLGGYGQGPGRKLRIKTGVVFKFG